MLDRPHSARAWLWAVALVGAGCDAPPREEPATVAPPVNPAPAPTLAPLETTPPALATPDPPLPDPPPSDPPTAETPPSEPPPEIPTPISRRPFGRPWLSDTRQPKTVAALYAKGLRGPLGEPFTGYVACKVAVMKRHWDDVLFPPKPKELPDIRVIGPTRAVILPDDRMSGVVGFPGVALDATTIIKLDIDDMDGLVDDDIAELELSAAGGFPMEAKSGEATATCVGVPAEAYAKDLEARRAAVEKALARFAEVKIDITRPEASQAAIEAPQEAIRQLAMFAGRDEVDTFSTRLEQAQATWRDQLFAAIDASLAAGVDTDGYRALASVKIRPSAARSDALEILALKPLRYEWTRRTLGAIKLWTLDADGQREVPAFPELTVDDKSLDAFTDRVARDKVVEFRRSASTLDAVYAGFTEGKQTLYFKLPR